jgi:hypothetical protein
MTSSTLVTAAEYGCTALMAAEFYVLPILVGWVRRVPGMGRIVLIDLVLGWTVVGWVLALAMALGQAAGSQQDAQLTPSPPSGVPVGRRARSAESLARQPGLAPPLALPPRPPGSDVSP